MKNGLLYILLLVISFEINAQTQLGNPINGISTGDNFGRGISISALGDVIAIGAQNSNVNGSIQGKLLYTNLWIRIGFN